MNIQQNQRPVEVLLVVGNVGVIRQVRHSLRQAKVTNRLHHVGDTAEARAYLRREGPYGHTPCAGLVLLDASLPQKSVIDLVAELKTDPQFTGIPVIVLAGSESEHRLIENCKYAVDGSIQRPFSPTKLVQILISIDTLSFLLVQSTPTV